MITLKTALIVYAIVAIGAFLFGRYILPARRIVYISRRDAE